MTRRDSRPRINGPLQCQPHFVESAAAHPGYHKQSTPQKALLGQQPSKVFAKAIISSYAMNQGGRASGLVKNACLSAQAV